MIFIEKIKGNSFLLSKLSDHKKGVFQ